MKDEILLPKHVAIIMDGNGRWAKERGLARIFGHQKGAYSVAAAIRACLTFKIPYLTLFCFSTENWNRPQEEVNALMEYFCYYLREKSEMLINEEIKVTVIGDLDKLSDKVRSEINHIQNLTKNFSRLELVLAVSYSGREEILAACKKIAQDVLDKNLAVNEISAETIEKSLWTANLPDPDLLIRTSGEYRISNFLLWQLAYTEIVFVKKYWPDFNEHQFKLCIMEYQKRCRRFGLTEAPTS